MGYGSGGLLACWHLPAVSSGHVSNALKAALLFWQDDVPRQGC